MATASVISEGGDQIVVLPPDFAIFTEGRQIEITMVGDGLVLSPITPTSHPEEA